MKLQVALDTLTIEQSKNLIEETKGSIDIIEVGTPFLLLEGMNPVRVFSEVFEDIEILADTKIMDAGELEASLAFEAGADIVTVLGVAYDETILGALKAARKFNGQIMIDMIGVPNLKARAQQLDEMGVHYLCVHTAFDIQSNHSSPLKELKEIQSVVKQAKTAIAGGINFKNIDEIVRVGVDVVVVGGTISNALDRGVAAKEMKEHLK